MSHVTFKTTHKRQVLLLWLTLVVFLVIALVGCGAPEGGQANPNETSSGDTDRQGGVEGIDVQNIETYDANVQVQKVTVGGIDCVIAVRNDQSGVALSCVGGTSSSSTIDEDDE